MNQVGRCTKGGSHFRNRARGDASFDRIRLMKTIRRRNLVTAALVGVVAFIAAGSRAADPLPSWNETSTKKAILEFVEKVTN